MNHYIRIFQVCVVSKLLYCLHTMWLNKTVVRKLMRFQANWLRSILHIPHPYIDQISNATVKRTGLPWTPSRAAWWSYESKWEAAGVRKPFLSSPTLPEQKYVTLQHLCAMLLPLPSSTDGRLSSHTQHSRHLQPASLSKIRPTIIISMASPWQAPQAPSRLPPHPPWLVSGLRVWTWPLGFAHLETGQYNVFFFDFDPVCRAAAHLGHRKWNAKALYVQTKHKNVKI